MGMRMLRRGLLISAVVATGGRPADHLFGGRFTPGAFRGRDAEFEGPQDEQDGGELQLHDLGQRQRGPPTTWSPGSSSTRSVAAPAPTPLRVSAPIFNATYALTLLTDRTVSGKYSVLEQFGAEHAGKHGICAYLISSTTGATYAWGGAFWNNVS